MSHERNEAIGRPKKQPIKSTPEAFVFFGCTDCGHHWRELWPMPMLCSVFAYKLRTTACPSCGNKYPYFAAEPDTKVEVDAPPVLHVA
jgi:DNA-directed RNA polymerase subunit M/transcription elongation factor TFIIS